MHWPYPVFALPIYLVRLSLGVVYFDTSPGDLVWGAMSVIGNVTLWAGGVLAVYLGEPAGRAASATAAVYAAIMGPFFPLLLLGWVTENLVYRTYRTFRRWFSGGPPRPAPSVTRIIPPSTSVVPENRRGASDCDSGTASSTIYTRVGGNSPFQARCVWRFGSQAKSLHSTPFPGRRAKPSALIYGDWFILDWARVRDANSPMSAELRATEVGLRRSQTGT